MKSNPEFEDFNSAMDAILSADPKAVKEAMEAEKRERIDSGKKKRGPKAKKNKEV